MIPVKLSKKHACMALHPILQNNRLHAMKAIQSMWKREFFSPPLIPNYQSMHASLYIYIY